MDAKLAGFVCLDKPAGLTSHDCVARVRRAVKLRQVGHGGTLDPMATGVLPIAIGRATRLLSFISSGKAYRATVRFGQTSTTDDAEGAITLTTLPTPISAAALQAVLPQFTGEIQQVPPRYSAIRHQGKRFYDLARQGLDLVPPTRTVTVHGLQLLDFRDGEFPEADLEVMCGEGTYIRALARDLGQVLGCGALLSRLRRLMSGPFEINQAVTLDDFCEAPETHLQPPGTPFKTWPRFVLASEQVWRWQCGQSLAASNLPRDGRRPVEDHRYTIWDGADSFQGLAEVTPEALLKPLRVWEVQQ